MLSYLVSYLLQASFDMCQTACLPDLSITVLHTILIT